DSLLVETWIERWGLRFEGAVAGWWLGEKDKAYTVFEQMLQRPDLTPPYRKVAEHNLRLRDKPKPANRSKGKKPRKPCRTSAA
ncbi:MAG TPA: hypothetical protein VFG00_14425, partial [Acidothermaceae bacterium]|nr:hypothetical protein [Acidothermaceae bacterium]